MRANRFIGVTALIFVAAGSQLLWAHHGSRISNDMSRTVTIQGVVTEYDFVNPHVYFMFDVTDNKGEVVHWGGGDRTAFRVRGARMEPAYAETRGSGCCDRVAAQNRRAARFSCQTRKA
jgi:hypothetical protein